MERTSSARGDPARDLPQDGDRDAHRSNLSQRSSVVNEPARTSSAENANGDVEVVGDLGEADADVAMRAEPELATVNEPGAKRLGDKQASRPVAGVDRGGVIEQRPRVKHFEHFGVRVPEHELIIRAERGEEA